MKNKSFSKKSSTKQRNLLISINLQDPLKSIILKKKADIKIMIIMGAEDYYNQ